jgi:hypothetical protein
MLLCQRTEFFHQRTTSTGAPPLFTRSTLPSGVMMRGRSVVRGIMGFFRLSVRLFGDTFAIGSATRRDVAFGVWRERSVSDLSLPPAGGCTSRASGGFQIFDVVFARQPGGSHCKQHCARAQKSKHDLSLCLRAVLCTAGIRGAHAGAVAAGTVMTVAHCPVNRPDVGLRRRSSANNMAIFASIKRRLPRLATTNGLIDFRLAKRRFQVGDKRRNLGHWMAERLANAHIHEVSPQKSVCSPLRKSV